MFGAVAVAVVAATGAAVKDHVQIVTDTVSAFEALAVSEQHVLRRTRGLDDRRHTTPFMLPLYADGKNWSLELRPGTDVVLPWAMRGDGKPFDTTGIYSGRVVGIEGPSKVHLAIDTDGSTMGFFQTVNETYFVRPSFVLEGAESASDHVVYKQSDVVHDDMPKMVGCANHGGYDTRMTEEQLAREDVEEAARTRSRRALVSAGPHVAGNKVCPLALYMDSSFISHFGDSTGLSIATEMLALANGIFETTDFTQGTGFKTALVLIDWATSGSTRANEVQTLLNNTGSTPSAQAYLEAFSHGPWGEVCLAHLLTYTDFSGTLGLAWTGFVNSANHNGGICQARYGTGGDAISLNTAFTTLLNFGQQQPVIQSSIVVTHELGHNYGSEHDADLNGQIPSGGVFIMYAFANQGTDPNNRLFSSQSIASISAVITDRGGCFVVAADPECGNGLIETNSTDPFTSGYEEVCDGGVNADDLCCKANVNGTDCADFTPGGAALKAGKECSPRSPSFGTCCTSGCLWEAVGTPCGAENECTRAGACTLRSGAGVFGAGVALYCPTGVAKNDTLSCEPGVVLSSGQRGSGLCDRGSCNQSICSLLTIGGTPLTACETISGSGACTVQCNASGQCLPIDEIGGLDAFSATYLQTSDNEFQPTAVAINDNVLDNFKKHAGALCTFRQGEPTSGICDSGGECKEADGESDSLAELRRQYAQFKRAFEDWAKEETAGVQNFVWLIIGSILILSACFSGCYFANRPQIQEVRRRRRSQKGQKAGSTNPIGI